MKGKHSRPVRRRHETPLLESTIDLILSMPYGSLAVYVLGIVVGLMVATIITFMQ